MPSELDVVAESLGLGVEKLPAGELRCVRLRARGLLGAQYRDATEAEGTEREVLFLEERDHEVPVALRLEVPVAGLPPRALLRFRRAQGLDGALSALRFQGAARTGDGAFDGYVYLEGGEEFPSVLQALAEGVGARGSVLELLRAGGTVELAPGALSARFPSAAWVSARGAEGLRHLASRLCALADALEKREGHARVSSRTPTHYGFLLAAVAGLLAVTLGGFAAWLLRLRAELLLSEGEQYLLGVGFWVAWLALCVGWLRGSSRALRSLLVAAGCTALFFPPAAASLFAAAMARQPGFTREEGLRVVGETCGNAQDRSSCLPRLVPESTLDPALLQCFQRALARSHSAAASYRVTGFEHHGIAGLRWCEVRFP